MPDHPWASFHDLMMLAGMGEIDQPGWLDKLQQGPPDMVGLKDMQEMQEMRDEWTEAWMELFAIQLAEIPGNVWKQALRKAVLRNVQNMRDEMVLQ